jgi:hypothetical protein
MNGIKAVMGIAVLAGILCLQACTHGRSLRTDSARGGNIQGSYTLILFGGNYADDLETVAILDKEGDRYTFEPYAPEFKYKIIKGQTPDHALPAAEQFIKGHPSFHGQRLQAVLDEDGTVIGYELRPLYLPLSYGVEDVLDIYYTKKGDKVVVTVQLKPFLERQKGDFRREDR